jgi:hypothetical protein
MVRLDDGSAVQPIAGVIRPQYTSGACARP